MIDSFLDLAQTPGITWVFAFAMLTGFARGLAGFGVGLVMLPITAATLGPTVAVPVLALIDLPMAMWLAKTVWHDFDRRELAVLVTAALVGIPVGIAFLLIIDPGAMKVGVSVIVLAFAIALMLGLKLPGRPSVQRSATTGFAAGLLQGAVSLPGPPLILGWLASQVPGPRLRANTIIFFAGLMLIAVPGYGFAGLLVENTLIYAALVFPFFGGGVIAGKLAAGHVPEIQFKRVVLCLVVAGAISAMVT